MSPTVAAKKPAVGAAAKALPYTGREYLDSLDDGREIWIYGERVAKITEHPAFQNCARMIARLYDALHEDHKSGKNVLTMPTEWGGFTHRYFKAPTSLEEQVAGRDAIAEWARVTYGWLGRSPDYKAAFLGTLGANAEFYAPFQENARRWYRLSQERVPFVNHAIIHPPVDRNVAPGAPGSGRNVFCHVTKETDGGHVCEGCQGRGNRLSANAFHFRGSSRPYSSAGQRLRSRVHGPDERQGRKADLSNFK